MVHVLAVDFEMHADSARHSPAFKNHTHPVILVSEGLPRSIVELYMVKFATTVNHIWKSMFCDDEQGGTGENIPEVGGEMASLHIMQLDV